MRFELLSEFDRIPGTAPTPQQLLIEPLSEREKEVLCLIAAGLSNSDSRTRASVKPVGEVV